MDGHRDARWRYTSERGGAEGTGLEWKSGCEGGSPGDVCGKPGVHDVAVDEG